MFLPTRSRVTWSVVLLIAGLLTIGESFAALHPDRGVSVLRLVVEWTSPNTEASPPPANGSIRESVGSPETTDARATLAPQNDEEAPALDALTSRSQAQLLGRLESVGLSATKIPQGPGCDAPLCSAFLIRSSNDDEATRNAIPGSDRTLTASTRDREPVRADAAALAVQSLESLPITTARAVPASSVVFDESGPYEDINLNGMRDPFEDLGPSNVGIDSDDDGKWDVLYGLYDADGDGSVAELCTGKDVPAPQCKVAGEWVYRDFIDDMNALLYLNGGVVDDRIQIFLDDIVYTGCGCWDASNPMQNDCESTPDHDDLGDPAAAACQSDEFGEPLWTFAVRGNKVVLTGKGADRRLNDTALMGPGTTRPDGRTEGTTIAIDNGNYFGRWFTQTHQSPYITVGMIQDYNAVGTVGKSGSFPSLVGNGKGWGGLTQDESLLTQTHRGSICLANGSVETSAAGWVDDLVSGDELVCVLPVSDTSPLPIGVPIRVRSVLSSSICNDPQSREVLVGTPTHSVGLAWGEIDDNAQSGRAFCYKPTDSYHNGQLTIENVKIEPQDYFGEAGGDCSSVGLWRFGTGDTDPSCDSHPMVIHYSGSLFMNDGVIGQGMSFTVDGGPVVGTVLLERMSWLYGRGEPIMDAGYRWKLRDIEIGYSQFPLSSSMLSHFGGYLEIDGLDIHNSTAGLVLSLTETTGVDVRNVRVASSFIANIVKIGCNVSDSVFENVSASGIDYGHQTTNRPTDAMLNFGCVEPERPTFGNRFINWSDDTAAHADFDIDRSRIVTFNPNSNLAVFGNYFEGLSNGSIDPNSTVFGASRDGNTRDVFKQNIFVGNRSEGGRVFSVTDGSGASTTEAIGVSATGTGNVSSRLPDRNGTGGIWRTTTAAIEIAAAGSERMLIRAPSTLTLDSIDCVATGSVAPDDVRVRVSECDADGLACASSGLEVTVSALTQTESDASPIDADVDFGDWVKLEITNANVAPDVLHCSLRYLE